MSSSTLTREQSAKAFDGHQYVYSHESSTVGCKMKFGVYVPEKAEKEQVPLLIFLSGLTCTEQNFITKSGVQSLASKYGFIVANPDTSPRGCKIEGDSEKWNFGESAGYYVDATESKWSKNYRMFSYINEEFYDLIVKNFNVNPKKIGILGHSMGGHGALISFFKRPGQYQSVSAFAPICNASASEWGINAYTNFFGQDETLWKQYDATELVASYNGPKPHAPVLVDQGSDDSFKDNQLFPERFIVACKTASFPLELREQAGYDHGYYFIMTFLEDHFKYHKNEFEHAQ
ncbi:unnamed protein product [Rotaria magnacalcarata]|uniref:S-formylglutathione hydrolase n=1 Tax=Rotaria magnacalcarata TaxID=392030 RepID=A0A816Z882_9BILA|nr:unnamed protein product [Rotaria magnacalcarata]CAF1662305.1 unnamed protein product [Rotaria magnacalcarata]CAF2047551.1 unnamed protein product [Rotaria magnacalcarata]CAF2196604.1 unnamed protein product [Rotaria magnacalcarata]CAF3832852.1 unnamed protein product [Rotaria magnacalcarata]